MNKLQLGKTHIEGYLYCTGFQSHTKKVKANQRKLAYDSLYRQLDQYKRSMQEKRQTLKTLMGYHTFSTHQIRIDIIVYLSLESHPIK